MRRFRLSYPRSTPFTKLTYSGRHESPCHYLFSAQEALLKQQDSLLSTQKALLASLVRERDEALAALKTDMDGAEYELARLHRIALERASFDREVANHLSTTDETVALLLEQVRSLERTNADVLSELAQKCEELDECKLQLSSQPSPTVLLSP